MTTTSGVPATRLDHLVGTVQRLWPDHDVSLVRARRSGGAHQLAFVPNSAAPRLLVPAGHPAAMSAALRRFSHSLSGRERASRIAVSTALRLGAVPVLADRIGITPRHANADSIESHLSEVLGQPVVVSLGVGSARANQKPVLQVFSTTGRSIAYVKVGDTDLSVGLVRGEARALSAVGSRAWQRLEVPRLLHLGSWNGLELLVISALDTVARSGPGPLLQPPLAALDELYDAYDDGRQALAESAYWRQLETTQHPLFLEALDRIAQAAGGTTIRFTAWHGDFAPWNLAWRNGRVQLWDWERFTTGVPQGLDRVHYVVHTMTRAAGFSNEVIDAALRSSHTRHPSCGEPEQRLVATLYLASISARYLAGSQTAAGEVLRPATAVVVEALVRHSKTLEKERTL
jgi:hypothetical protein